MNRRDTDGKRPVPVREKRRKAVRLSSFGDLAAYAKGDPVPEEKPARGPDPDRVLSEFVRRATEREEAAKGAFYARYEKAMERARAAKAAAPKPVPEGGPGVSGQGMLLRDAKTDAAMAAFDAFTARKAARKASAAKRYAAIPPEFHRKGFRSDGRFVKRAGWEEKVHTVRTRCSCCGREFEFETPVLSSWRYVKAFCSDRCRYAWCYGREGRAMRGEGK